MSVPTLDTGVTSMNWPVRAVIEPAKMSLSVGPAAKSAGIPSTVASQLALTQVSAGAVGGGDGSGKAVRPEVEGAVALAMTAGAGRWCRRARGRAEAAVAGKMLAASTLLATSELKTSLRERSGQERSRRRARLPFAPCPGGSGRPAHATSRPPFSARCPPGPVIVGQALGLFAIEL